MAITSTDLLLAGLVEKIFPFNKSSITTVGGAFYTLWNATGIPGAGSLSIGNTGAGDIPTDATDGAWPFTNPGGGVLTYLARLFAGSSIAGNLYLIDRCWHAGSFSFSNGTINATDSTPVDRPASGDGVEMWCEINTALSAVACTLTATYVNQNGTGSRTATCVVPASAITARMFPFVLQAGDVGVQQITNLSGSAAPTGSFNMVLLRKLGLIGMPAVGVGSGINPFTGGMPRIYDDSCLALMGLASTTTSGNADGHFRIAQG